MRVHVCAVQMTLHRADVLEAYLNGQDNIQKATVYERTGDVVLTYRGSRLPGKGKTCVLFCRRRNADEKIRRS